VKRVCVYTTHPERPIYAREIHTFICLNMYSQPAGQPLHLVVCKNCIAPTKAKSL
jgi:hypothetical protein